MKKILAFGASNSRRSINQRLAHWAAKESGLPFDLLDLNDYEMPIYSIDREEQNGFPKEALAFKQLVRETDGIIISLAEHNGAYTTAFKNIVDWISRIEKGIFSNKPMFLLATSPGARGAQTVLQIATDSFQRRGGDVIASFSLPSFNDNFDSESGITDPELLSEFRSKLEQFKAVVVDN